MQLYLGLSILFITVAQANAGSCLLRCNSRPTLLDYWRPIGCYCHFGCGGKLKCCKDYTEKCAQGCQLPKTISRATYSPEKLSYTKGEGIVYECDYNYKISGSSTRTCMGNNIWSFPPTCRYATSCRPPRIYHGTYNEKRKQYYTGDKILISCDPEYILQGSSSLTCLRRNWSPSRPTCMRDWCARTTYCSEHATCINFSYSARCRCLDGFEGSGYTCKPIPCYEHRCRKDQTCIDSGNEDGRYTCECNEGFAEDGNSCKRIPCYMHTCRDDQICSNNGDGTGAYTCECKEGYAEVSDTCKEASSGDGSGEGSGGSGEGSGGSGVGSGMQSE